MNVPSTMYMVVYHHTILQADFHFEATFVTQLLPESVGPVSFCQLKYQMAFCPVIVAYLA